MRGRRRRNRSSPAGRPGVGPGLRRRHGRWRGGEAGRKPSSRTGAPMQTPWSSPIRRPTRQGPPPAGTTGLARTEPGAEPPIVEAAEPTAGRVARSTPTEPPQPTRTTEPIQAGARPFGVESRVVEADPETAEPPESAADGAGPPTTRWTRPSPPTRRPNGGGTSGGVGKSPPPGDGGGQSERRGGEDHHLGQPGCGPGRARVQGPGHRPRPPGQRHHRPGHRRPKLRAFDVRRDDARRFARRLRRTHQHEESVRGAGHHRPGRSRNRAGARPSAGSSSSSVRSSRSSTTSTTCSSTARPRWA